MDPIKYQIHTFGCKVNTYDTGLIQKNLKVQGKTFEAINPNESSPRIHVLNTCAVTAEATKEAVKLIRRLKSKDPFCTVVVTGCGAQVDTEAFSSMKAADLVVANSHKSQLPFIIEKFFKGEIQDKVFKSNIFRKEDLEMGGGEEASHTRAFLKIQDGCNSFCTYCIIPYARGKSRSITMKDLAQRVNELYAMGVREVVLTGVHIGDYEDLMGSTQFKLEDLIEYLLMKTQMPRFRLSSLEPVEVTSKLLDLYVKNDRLCPHFHMSIQSAQSKVLKDMKRQYGQQEVIQSLNQIREKIPNAFIGMDVIVGFPTETHEDFEETYLTLAQLPWTKIHVFPYSERQGTRAAVMDVSVPVQERQQRAMRLRELSLDRFEETARAQIGSLKEILLLNYNHKKKAEKVQTYMMGVSRDYWNVKLELNEKLKSFLQEHELASGSSTDQGMKKNMQEEIQVRIIGYEHSDKSSLEGVLRGELV